MDDISDVIQHATITIGEGKSADAVVLPPVSFKNWGVIQKGLIKKKKQGILQAALDMRELVTPFEYEELRSAALQECGRIRAVGVADFQEMLTNEEGVGLIIWVLVEEVRKGKYTEQDVISSIETMSEVDAQFVIESLQTLLGLAAEEEDADGDGETPDPNDQSEEVARSSQ